MKIEVVCEICEKKFTRERGEVNRNIKKKQQICCSKRCLGKCCIKKNIPKERQHLSWKDDYSPFRLHLRWMRNKNKGRGGRRKPVEVTLQDLKDQWDKQKGICPYTGWKLKNHIHTYEKIGKTPDRASVDRIDSSKSYTKDNIEFVSLMAQFAKNYWKKEELFEFCKAVADNHENQRINTAITRG